MFTIAGLAVALMAILLLWRVYLMIFRKDTAPDDDARMEDYTGF
jgi:hypothetical protein